MSASMRPISSRLENWARTDESPSSTRRTTSTASARGLVMLRVMNSAITRLARKVNTTLRIAGLGSGRHVDGVGGGLAQRPSGNALPDC